MPRLGPGEVELKSLLVEADGIAEAHNAYSWFDVSASGSPDGDALPAIKLSRSEVTKCSPSTISDGSEQGIIRRL